MRRMGSHISNKNFLLIVVFVYQVNNNFYHNILLFCSALGNHQRESNEGAIRYALASIWMIENVVIVKEPKEQRSGNAFVSVAERVVLGNEIEQHSCFLLHAGIEFFPAKSLVYLSYAAFEGVVLLVAKENRATKLFT